MSLELRDDARPISFYALYFILVPGLLSPVFLFIAG